MAKQNKFKTNCDLIKRKYFKGYIVNCYELLVDMDLALC